ncbi:FtsX-like permease family protein [Paucibacter sp. APW11]|uniref:FtsX-like permease family protein n=1 Tax=Roseateles aquae TaxID=3077235 RepID=A0ABU3PBB5_9BURK|nr:FtsX-like permease family protein [Paucibacter sp. APW11]MDT8999859.1 FtsX-like permease family protein [Paucibacter sp. APW11]
MSTNAPRLTGQLSALLRVSVSSLWQSKWSSLTIISCVMLVVLVLMGFLAMAAGYENSHRNSGAADLAVLMAEEARSESSSRINRDQLSLLEGAPGIAHDLNGTQLSAEFCMTVAAQRRAGEQRLNISLRGLQAQGRALRQGFRLVGGRMFESGRNELIVGRALATQIPTLAIGQTTRLAGRDWLIVGHFSLDSQVFEAEAWGDITAVQSAYGRANQYQSIRLRLQGPDSTAALAKLQEFNSQDQRLKLNVQTERQFYQRQSEGTSNLMVYLGWPLAMVLAVGTLAGTFNTMLIAVQARRHSLRVLALLGFQPGAVFAAVLFEALSLALIGGLLGIALSLLIFNGLQDSTVGAGFISSHFNWRVDLASMSKALTMALLLGLLGGLAPAWRCLTPTQGTPS